MPSTLHNSPHLRTDFLKNQIKAASGGTQEALIVEIKIGIVELEVIMNNYWVRRHNQDIQLISESGQGLVELALVIPVLIIIVVGSLDLGRVFFSVITVTNVAREGARYLTLHPDDSLYDNTAPVCYDLVITPPNPKPGYYCTIQAARQEAQAGFGAPLVVNPTQITIVPTCPDTDDAVIGCDRASQATVTAQYDFRSLTLWFLPDTLRITRTARMMVP